MKTISIESLAEKIQGKLWIKEDIKRVYLDRGYNTKKMSTESYIFQRRDKTFGVVCEINCPNQNLSWISSQEAAIVEEVTKDLNDLIEEYGVEIDIVSGVESIEEVQGYTLYWQEVRVPINSYGKLATRKRQFVKTYKGAKANAPYRIIELNDTDFSQAIKLEENRIQFKYGENPTFG